MAHQKHKELIEILDQCIFECNQCLSACLKEEKVQMLTKCIGLDLDCMEICRITASSLARHSEHAHHLLKECAETCISCAEECEKHAYMEHCNRCAEICRKCAEICSSPAK